MCKGIVDVDSLQMLEPDLFLPFLGDALDDASCDLPDPVLFLRAAPGEPLPLESPDEGERPIAASWEKDGEGANGVVCGDKGGGDVLSEENGCKGELFSKRDKRDGSAFEYGVERRYSRRQERGAIMRSYGLGLDWRVCSRKCGVCRALTNLMRTLVSKIGKRSRELNSLHLEDC